MEFDLENPLAGTYNEHPKHCSTTPLALFAAESDHMSSLVGALDQLAARCHALSFIVEVQFRNNLDSLLAYLAANYVDRFLSKRQIPSEKPWAAQLLAMSCLSIASKMKKLEFPISNVQREVGCIFDAQSIWRMELLVLGALEWRMRSITPFSFLKFFLSYFVPEDLLLLQAVKVQASHIILNSQIEIKMLDFRPSVITAAALLAAAQRLAPAHFPAFRCALHSCQYLNQESLTKCCNTMDCCDELEETSNGRYSGLTPVTVLIGHSAGWPSSESKTNIKSASATSGRKDRRFATGDAIQDRY